MALPGFLKKKRTYIVLVLILLAAGYVWYLKAKSGQVAYETITVSKSDLVQTVEVTGEIKPAARVELSFKNSGKIAKINVGVGDDVEQGDVLAELEDFDVTFAARSAAASLSIAQANLNQRLAGETTQSIRVAETQVEQAQAALDKSLQDLESIKQTTADSVRSAEIALANAQDSLRNSDAVVTQTNQNAYDTARTYLLNALGPLQTGLTDGDQIIGVDNSAANASFSSFLGVLDAGSVERAKNSYKVAKSAKIEAERLVRALTTDSTKDDIQTAADELLVAIRLIQDYLTDVQKVLAATIPSTSFTTADLTAKKTVIDADRINVSNQKTTVENAVQAIANTSLTKTQTIQQLENAVKSAQVGLDTARTNAEVQVKTAETNIAIQRASLDAARATFDLRKSGPRSVDVSPLSAAVEQARVAYDKAQKDLENIQILAPVNGTISEVLPDVGEQIMANTIAVKMVGTEMYDIEAKVPESDIVKVAVGQKAVITLDAYGDDVEFEGSVIAKDPAETKVQDAVYYKIRVQIKPDGREVKPGMTANVTITTAEAKGVVWAPSRSIKTSNGSTRQVRILVEGEPQERIVETGLRGDEGRIEIKSGLKEGDIVVLGEKK
jgi:HlyD family secretion protein